MNGKCYYSEGVNPTLTCNKGEGGKIAIPVITPARANKRQNGRRFKEDGEAAFTLTSQDIHGVAVEVEPLQINSITGYDTTLKSGGGVTETARTLMARDYKGLGGQKMTAAMLCFSSTKALSHKNEKSQTALKQEKTEDCQKESKKEH